MHVDEVAALPAVLEDARCPAVLQGRPEDRGHPAVRRVPRHPRPVHVVVAQGHDRTAGLPAPRRAQMLLRDLGGGVDAARVERGVLGDQSRGERGRADRAAGLEPSRHQVGRRPRGPGAPSRAAHTCRRPRRRRPWNSPAPAVRLPRGPSPREAPRCPGRCSRRTREGRPDRRRARPSRPDARPRRPRTATRPRPGGRARPPGAPERRRRPGAVGSGARSRGRCRAR